MLALPATDVFVCVHMCTHVCACVYMCVCVCARVSLYLLESTPIWTCLMDSPSFETVYCS